MNHAWLRPLGLSLTVVLASSTALGAPSPSGATKQDAGPVAPVPLAADQSPALDSPRASLSRFLELTRRGRYEEAARYLDAPEAALAPELARKLRVVLDRYVGFDLETISGASVGRSDDGLPAGVDEMATVPGLDGIAEPVRLVRHREEAGSWWRFPRATVERVDSWYERLDDRWALEHLPAVLLSPGPFSLYLWQLLALPLFFLLAFVTGYFVNKVVLALLGHAVRRTSTKWDDLVLERLGGPLTALGFLAAVYLYLPGLSLNHPAELTVHRVLRAGFFVVFFWSLLRGVDVAGEGLALSPWAKEHSASRSLLPLARRVSKVVVFGMAVIAVLSELGYPVASLIAGLGIGGLALALAAQKTVENLFGSVSIGVDQPFRKGDFVCVDGVTGTVEEIGLRSTRIRTLDRTVVSLPNGKLAEMRIETFGARDRIRLVCALGLVYATRAGEVRAVLAGIEQRLHAHPKIVLDSVQVRLAGLTASALNVEIVALFDTAEWSEFTLIRQEMLLAFLEVVERAGTSLAFPTQTLFVNTKARELMGSLAEGPTPMPTRPKSLPVPGPEI